MKKNIEFILFLFLIFLTVSVYANTNPVINYIVAFYNVKSVSKQFPSEACQAMMKSFNFNKQGEQYFFNQQDNPSYHNHRVMGILPINKNEFLEVDNIDEKFKYNNKEYNMITVLSSITYLYPFQVRGLLNNEFCSASYVVLENNITSST